jgi:type III secretion protein U
VAEQKPFKPTQKRLAQARKEGKVLKSQTLTQGVALLAILCGAFFLIRLSLVRNRMLLEYMLLDGFRAPLAFLRHMWSILLKVVAGSLIFGSCVSIIVEIAQVGFRFDTVVLSPKASRFDLGEGVKKIGSGVKQSWLKLLSFFLLVSIFSWFFGRLMAELPWMFFASREAGLAALLRWCGNAAALGVVVLLGVGGLEYFVRRRSFFRELSMSHEELRREHREAEGDPYCKAVRRSLHEAVLQGELVARVRKAKVIIVESR